MLSLLAVHDEEPKSPPKHTVVAEALPAVMETPAKARAPVNAKLAAIPSFICPLPENFSDRTKQVIYNCNRPIVNAPLVFRNGMYSR
jgi:hypothetical protein